MLSKRENRTKVSEMIRKLILKSYNAVEILKKLADIVPEEFIQKINGLRFQIYRFKKNQFTWNSGYFKRKYSIKQKIYPVIKKFIRNQIDQSNGYKTSKEISIEIRNVFSITVSEKTVCRYQRELKTHELKKEMQNVLRRVRSMQLDDVTFHYQFKPIRLQYKIMILNIYLIFVNNNTKAYTKEETRDLENQKRFMYIERKELILGLLIEVECNLLFSI
ncbi:hypothetical protein BpHYR1_034494 [Brachionus plicatilis]|uniref:Uncharacterized protein n=1 Tax=Brachionus plicatilis TaxID=10195 RepID=A0A3M7RPH5_BRAPC|nr:hypothetical protein BpHYR1_034494 [Brachionus plicatilis]